MSIRDDGGPAFPIPGLSNDADFNGMSLRDWFAGMALQGGLCFHQEDGCLRHEEDAATIAYRFADAMLAARGK